MSAYNRKILDRLEGSSIRTPKFLLLQAPLTDAQRAMLASGKVEFALIQDFGPGDRKQQ